MRCKATTRKGKKCRNFAIDSTGFCRTHHPNTAIHPSTGSAFEESCLKVLRLLGYIVDRNVTIDGCQIDIYAEFRTGIIPLRLMVECKDLGLDRNVGIGEVKEFAGILNTARGSVVDKGLLITTHGFTREAKEFSKAAGIQLACFSELATQLVPFDDYIDRIISEYESLSVSHYYINLSASYTEDYDIENESSFDRPLAKVVNRLLFQEERNKVALLGNFGTGKSTFCTKYAYDLAKMFNENRTLRIPLVINLSDYESKLDIQELVTNTLQFRYGLRIDLTICQELQRLGRFLFLFDGFDEMATRVDPDIIRDNLREINKISRIKENKFILTCRTHFFRDRVQAEILSDFDLLYIPEWGNRELREYLKKRFGGEWRKHLDRIHGTHNLTELAQTPLFMEMIVETLPKLGSSVRRAALYKVYTNNWIREQSRRRGSRLSSAERETVVKELSQRMYLDGKSSCHYSEFTPIITRRFKTVDAAQIDYLESDVRTCTFLTRDTEGHYRFRHKSFMEFFVAQSISDFLLKSDINMLAAKLLSLEVRGFVIDILRDDPPAELLKKCLQDQANQILRDNSLSIAAALRIDLKDTPLESSPADDFDPELFARFLQGESQAFDTLFRTLRFPLRNLLIRHVREDDIVEDIIMETFLKLWQNRDRIDQIKNVKRYVFTLAKNLLSDHFRKRREPKRLYSINFEDFAFNLPADSGASNKEEKAIIDKALRKLSPRERQIIKGCYIKGMTVSELSKELGLPPSTVSSIKYRAMRKLKEILKDQF